MISTPCSCRIGVKEKSLLDKLIPAERGASCRVADNLPTQF